MTWVIVVAIILILYAITAWNTNHYEDYINGFWIAENDEFCKNSEISSMMLYIGDADEGWFSTTRNGYLVIMDDLCNQSFTITYSRGFGGVSIGRYSVSARVEFEDEQVWDEDIVIEVDIITGIMRIRSGDTLYARLHKQHNITNSI